MIRLLRLRPSVIVRLPLTESTLKMPPCSVVTALPSGTSALATLAPTTWYCSTLRSSALLPSNWALDRLSSASSAANASLVGANTV